MVKKGNKSASKKNTRGPGASDENSNHASLSGIHRPLSLVAQVERTLRAAIENNVFPTGRLPTLLDLAKQLHVSSATVRVALDSLQKEGLVVKRQRRGTFIRSPEVPSRLSQTRSKVLGYLCEELELNDENDEIVSRPCSSQMLKGAVFEASQRGYQLNIRSAKSYQLRETFGQMEATVPLCGVVFETVVEEKFLKGFSGRSTPAILLDHEMHLPSIGSVRSDSQQNAILAISRLAKIGHRQIACANCQQSIINPWFIQGYRKGMREVGLRRRRLWEMCIELSRKGAEESIEQLLALSPRPTAIICFNNTFAYQLIAVARKRGLRVPTDLSVVGCGGEEVVNLTCTQLDWHAMGRSAVQMLLNAIDQGATYEPEHLLVPYEWREGGTMATLGTEDQSETVRNG